MPSYPPQGLSIFFVLSVGFVSDGAMLYALWQWKQSLIDSGQLTAGGFLFGMTGAVCTIWGLLLLWKRVSWYRSLSLLKSNGHIAHGVITKIGRDKRYSSGKSLLDYPWFVLVQWADSQGQKHVSESELISFNVSEVVKVGDSIDVRYSVKNPNCSWVDVKEIRNRPPVAEISKVSTEPDDDNKKNLLAIFWPDIRNRESARKVGMQGCWAALISAALTALFAIASYLGFVVIAGIDMYAIIDSILLSLLAIGIWRMSRSAAVIGLLYFVVSKIFLISQIGINNPILLVIFILFFVNGVRGTFAYQRLGKN